MKIDYINSYIIKNSMIMVRSMQYNLAVLLAYFFISILRYLKSKKLGAEHNVWLTPNFSA